MPAASAVCPLKALDETTTVSGSPTELLVASKDGMSPDVSRSGEWRASLEPSPCKLNSPGGSSVRRSTSGDLEGGEVGRLFRTSSLYMRPGEMDEDMSFAAKRRGLMERWRKQRWRVQVVELMDDVRSQCVLFLALLIALFAADVAGIVSAPDDYLLLVDGLLLGIFVLFGSEFVLNCLARDDYTLSFFFWMDLIGTLSIVADISWMAQDLGLADADENTLKASRAARVGGKAGRLTRVLKVVRLLKLVFHFIFNPTKHNTDTLASSGEAPSKIGQSLTEAISYQVSSLVLLTVLVIPMLAPFDESGMATDAYANLLDSRYVDLTLSGADAATVQRSLQPLVIDFFKYFKEQVNYKPVALTITTADGAYAYSWPSMDWNALPERSKDVYETEAGHVLIIFDISQKNHEAAMFNIMFIVYVLIALVTFSAILSAKSATLVVRPLERIFSVINEHASHVLGMLDLDFSQQEMERAVSRVRLMMSNFNARGSKAAEDFLEGNDQVDAETKAWLISTYTDQSVRNSRTITVEEQLAVQNNQNRRRDSAEKKRRLSHIQQEPGTPLYADDFKALLPMLNTPEHRQDVMEILNTNVDTWDFDAFKYSTYQLYMCVYLMFDSLGVIDDGMLPTDAFWHFIDHVNRMYHANPYHNFKHCIDVTQAVYQLIAATHTRMQWTVEEKFALLVGAICHDLDHPGVNNAFLVNTRDTRALRYNDASVLENVHIATLYQLVGENPEANVFRFLEEDLQAWARVRKIIVSIIMHTDMIHHFSMVAKLELLNDVHADQIFDSTKEVDPTARTPARTMEHSPGEQTPARGSATPRRASYEKVDGLSFLSAEERSFVMNVIMHSADISNPTKPFAVYKKWAHAVMDEFFEQGDMEKANHMPVSPMMDRDNTSLPVAQVNFIEFVVTPLYKHLYTLFPEVKPMMVHLVANRVRMGEMCFQEEEHKAGATQQDVNEARQKNRTRFAKYIEQHHLKDVMEHLQTERDALGKDTRTPARTHEVKLTKRHSTASSISTISTGTDIMPSTHEVDTKEATKSHKRFSLEIMPKFPFGSAASVEDLQNTLP